MDPETINTRDEGILSGKGNSGKEVKEVFGPSGKRDPQSRSRRRPLLEYRLSGTEIR